MESIDSFRVATRAGALVAGGEAVALVAVGAVALVAGGEADALVAGGAGSANAMDLRAPY